MTDIDEAASTYNVKPHEDSYLVSLNFIVKGLNLDSPTALLMVLNKQEGHLSELSVTRIE